MIKHIVFFGLAVQAEGKTKAENAAYIKTELENLKNLIPQIKNIEVGFNHHDADPNNYDVALYSEFDTLDDVNIYQVHPEHKRVAAYIAKVRTSRAAIDYEI
ncbi:MAG: Dabb family protein [Paludibacter sp.]|nr:Dabb family protein [Paludibacter sp.]